MPPRGGAREGAGRKPTGRERKIKQSYVVIPEVSRGIAKAAKFRDMSASELVSSILLAWLRRGNMPE